MGTGFVACGLGNLRVMQLTRMSVLSGGFRRNSFILKQGQAVSYLDSYPQRQVICSSVVEREE
jgi:hypothetical protein